MSEDLSSWQRRPLPERIPLSGRYVRLEPIDPKKHAEDLYQASTVDDATARFGWLFEEPPKSRLDFQQWLDRCEASGDPLFFAVIDQSSGRAVGRQSLMRIDQGNGVIEIGNIYWSPAIAGTRGATEAQYLFMQHVFRDLGYRRYEWKCNNENAPSKRAALRFGFDFEGVFRQHMVFKGGNRDTAWFAIIDKDWPQLAKAYDKWLDPSNFDATGKQQERLGKLIEKHRTQSP
jgi:RimJ/RimL family protein N-acetyltransferase